MPKSLSTGESKITLTGDYKMNQSLNTAAAQLRTKLFNLQNEFSDLGQAVINSRENPVDLRIEAKNQIDEAMYALRKIYESLGDVFTDGYKDPKDQSFCLNLEANNA